RSPRSNFFRQRDDRLRKAPRVVDVGGVVIAEPLHGLVIQSDGVPCQRRRYLQSSKLLRLVGIVAQSELAGDRDDMRAAVHLHFKLISRDGESLAVNRQRPRPCGEQENERYQEPHRKTSPSDNYLNDKITTCGEAEQHECCSTARAREARRDSHQRVSREWR